MGARRHGSRELAEAERLALHNAEMKLALAENISLDAARRRLAWLRFKARQRTFLRCGTATGHCQTADRPAPHYWWQDL